MQGIRAVFRCRKRRPKPCIFIQQAIIHLPQAKIISQGVLLFVEETGNGIAGADKLIALQGIGTGYKYETDHLQYKEENQVEKPPYEENEVTQG